MKLFDNLSIKEFILEALRQIHFQEMTPVQNAVIPKALEGKNLIVQSQTGTGKTHSFLVPLFNQLDPSKDEVQAVITAPSRELATQLFEAARQINEHAPHPFTLENFVGGTDRADQIDALGSRRQPQVVIGTPGRIFDLMSSNALWVQTGTLLVIDEADMTMDLGFLPTMDEIASRMAQHLQILAFSATIPQQLSTFLKKYMTNPETVVISPENVLAPTITNYLINSRHRDRKELVYDLLTLGHPFLALVFANTKEYVEEVANYLKGRGLKVAVIHGDLTARERQRVMRQIRHLEFQYIVATDLAARGIDIPGVSMVINTEVPYELEYFVHRVGRTGRNNLPGTAYTFYTPDDDRAIQTLENRGVDFEEVAVRNGEIAPQKSRHSRQERRNRRPQEADPVVKGMVRRNKRQRVKPGHRKKLKQEIASHRRRQNKQNKQRGRRGRR